MATSFVDVEVFDVDVDDCYVHFDDDLVDSNGLD